MSYMVDVPMIVKVFRYVSACGRGMIFLQIRGAAEFIGNRIKGAVVDPGKRLLIFELNGSTQIPPPQKKIIALG